MRALGLLAFLAISGGAAAQTANTTCQQYGSQMQCQTRYQESRPDRFKIDTPDILGSFERGRAQARQAEREELELRMLRQQVQQQDLRRQLEVEQMQLQEQASHQRTVDREQRYSDAASYYSQQSDACTRIALKEHQQQIDKAVDAMGLCMDKLLISDPRFAEAAAITKPQRDAAAQKFAEGMSELARKERQAKGE